MVRRVERQRELAAFVVKTRLAAQEVLLGYALHVNRPEFAECAVKGTGGRGRVCAFMHWNGCLGNHHALGEVICQYRRWRLRRHGRSLRPRAKSPCPRGDNVAPSDLAMGNAGNRRVVKIPLSPPIKPGYITAHVGHLGHSPLFSPWRRWIPDRQFVSTDACLVPTIAKAALCARSSFAWGSSKGIAMH